MFIGSVRVLCLYIKHAFSLLQSCLEAILNFESEADHNSASPQIVLIKKVCFYG